MEALAITSMEQQAHLSEYRFLAEWRDYISRFRFRLVLLVEKVYDLSSWERLSVALQEEGLPESAQDVTSVVKASLLEMGLLWTDWEHLRVVADAGIAIMHTTTGKLTTQGTDQALRSIDTVYIPTHMVHTRGALRKAILYLKSAPPMSVKKKVP